ncbi:LSU ribosomal protein L9P [Candidatus Kryptonium thompsonii]|jgi:large subunit ribosomal protein L9|uniref:Large ribosomal subunit protein bL9 n=1 Tax=Candidatus Kryptonium thompsonii TaxID=1633631 RepID=A0A0P1LAP5_9BACT|nr:50S ribosomal protein L9 [Candidatus Kryptonium thompsoni]CUS76370.1 LSU ribosomal protein L9P [Candidatus Kryptonium thompsoni]CUS78213.1 LSU ribosomal protein L9P [Candidatus Kryptonium thompsoni]CUS80544.1 LSU ribosomal protein L9P [Candidatus Kryptonium thompsoni]CUS81974.1 LSU ribosomal protein L9P [Candidatus Kryptonium thompsoni]CUS91194.1 LSU ribosomal protein L9P [Candidatus Kryptonium thompsoni]
MKVILRQNFENLGKFGDIVEVKDGYARNFLIPRGIALPATPGNIKMVETEKKQKAFKLERERLSAQKLAEELAKVEITIPMRAGENERLFGSVTAQMIADELRKLGFEIDRRKILLDEPIKMLGKYEIPVKLHPEVNAKINLNVVQAEEEKDTKN